jgi:hypothetical protein
MLPEVYYGSYQISSVVIDRLLRYKHFTAGLVSCVVDPDAKSSKITLKNLTISQFININSFLSKK